MRVTEVKRHVDGRVERFGCELLLRRPHLAIVRFDYDEELRACGFVVPAGSHSYGFFWRRRPYQLYRMLDPDGRLITYRFDVVEDMRLGEEEISYTDLLLDVCVDAQGSIGVEDEDEVAEYAHLGLLSAAQRARIERTRGLLLRRHAAITREAVRLLP